MILSDVTLRMAQGMVPMETDTFAGSVVKVPPVMSNVCPPKIDLQRVFASACRGSLEGVMSHMQVEIQSVCRGIQLASR